MKYKHFKRFCDILFSFLLLVLLSPLFILALLISSIETKSVGIFFQKRIGLKGRSFMIYKIKTMIDSHANSNHITIASSPRITRFGQLFRYLKIDEIPQLINVVKGDMSFVGPRPDVPLALDLLSKDQYVIITSVRPGITSPASIKFKDEEHMLLAYKDPVSFYNNVIYPEKTNLNLIYISNQNFFGDVYCMLRTLI